jgi:hypothetical protein
MPKRPSKAKAAKSAPAKGTHSANLPSDQRSQERHRQFTTRATLGKFQGRKSI